MIQSKLIEANYDVKIKDFKTLDQYFGTEIHFADTTAGKYIIKSLPLSAPSLENEGTITDFLYDNGIPVARLLKTKSGGYVVKTDKVQFHMQEYIEGEIFKLNTAPDWFMEKTSNMLGQIHAVLKNYGELSVNFGTDFFRKESATERKRHYSKQLSETVDNGNTSLIISLRERIKHLDRISAFDIKPERLTYANSHGDYYIGQIIAKDKDITVIDWTSACMLPAGLEVIMSYVFAAPECKDGKIEIDMLKRYIDHYHKRFQLNAYDIQALPYIFYFQQIMCHYPPPYDNISDTYRPVCDLINNFTGWLYGNVEVLSKKLSAQ